MATPVLLVTANVGSIFEDPQVLLKIWVKEFLMTVSKLKPKFLALHCQEVGGKNYEESMRHVEDFVRTLMASEELMEFDEVRVFLDEDFTCTEKFTALGNLYFIHSSQKDVHLWDFAENIFVPVFGKEVHSGNIESVPIKEKAKFPQEFFPECKWSRKGFMRTRWLINGTIIDLVNIHLFHDASNFISNSEFPSTYTKNRRHAFEYTLDRLEQQSSGKIPYFLFGDFNFRLDTRAVIQKITNQTNPIHIKSAKNGEVVKMLFRDPNNENKVMLTLEKKVFDYENEETFHRNENIRWLLDYDKELSTFADRLFEFNINFPPSYPFEEDSSSSPTSYMNTRCPAWCDRILMNKSAKKLIYFDENDKNQVQYQMMGSTVSMGDHKPIYLLFNLMPMKGMNQINELDVKSIDSETEHMAWHERHDKDYRFTAAQNRIRTHSIPSLSYNSQHIPARRATSAFTATTNHVIHSNEWYLKTQELFRALQSKTQSCNRLTSHHSSSSEEWYSDFNQIESRDPTRLDCRRISEASKSSSDNNNDKTFDSCDESLQKTAQQTIDLMHDNSYRTNETKSPNNDNAINSSESLKVDSRVKSSKEGNDSNSLKMKSENSFKTTTQSNSNCSSTITRYVHVQAYTGSPITIFRETSV